MISKGVNIYQIDKDGQIPYDYAHRTILKRLLEPTDDKIATYISKYPMEIENIHPDLLSIDIYKKAFDEDNTIIKYIPHKYHDDIFDDCTIEI